MFRSQKYKNKKFLFLYFFSLHQWCPYNYNNVNNDATKLIPAWQNIFVDIFSVFEYIYAKNPPSTLYGNALNITFIKVTSDEIVCNSPKQIADTIINIVSFFIILCTFLK